MKFFKNMFGSKQKKMSKNEPNTLAEANESPDLRLATSKEKEVDIPVIKKEEVKKIPRKSATATATKAKTDVEKADNVEAEKKPATKKTTTVAQKNETLATATTEKKAEKETKVSAENEDTKPKSTAKTTTKKAVKSEETAGNNTAEKSDNTTKKAATETKKTAKNTDSSEKKTTSVTEKKAAEPKEIVANPDETTAENEGVVTASGNARTGKFEIKKSKDGRFVFNLYASNSVIVATSQVYSSSTSAMNGIKSVIANAGTSPIEDQTLKNVVTVPYPKWEIYLDKGDQYRFRLCASNGSCVCHSQGYTSKANCKKGIESIIKFSQDAEITKAYLEKKDK